MISDNDEILNTYTPIFIFAIVAITFTIVQPVPIDTFSVIWAFFNKGVIRIASELG